MTASDPVVGYIRKIHEVADARTELVRTRSVAMGYAFGRADEHFANGGEPPKDGHARAFADFYQENTDGDWADLERQYAAFQTRKDGAA